MSSTRSTMRKAESSSDLGKHHRKEISSNPKSSSHSHNSPSTTSSTPQTPDKDKSDSKRNELKSSLSTANLMPPGSTLKSKHSKSSLIPTLRMDETSTSPSKSRNSTTILSPKNSKSELTESTDSREQSPRYGRERKGGSSTPRDSSAKKGRNKETTEPIDLPDIPTSSLTEHGSIYDHVPLSAREKDSKSSKSKSSRRSPPRLQRKGGSDDEGQSKPDSIKSIAISSPPKRKAQDKDEKKDKSSKKDKEKESSAASSNDTSYSGSKSSPRRSSSQNLSESRRVSKESRKSPERFKSRRGSNPPNSNDSAEDLGSAIEQYKKGNAPGIIDDERRESPGGRRNTTGGISGHSINVTSTSESLSNTTSANFSLLSSPSKSHMHTEHSHNFKGDAAPSSTGMTKRSKRVEHNHRTQSTASIQFERKQLTGGIGGGGIVLGPHHSLYHSIQGPKSHDDIDLLPDSTDSEDSTDILPRTGPKRGSHRKSWKPNSLMMDDDSDEQQNDEDGPAVTDLVTEKTYKMHKISPSQGFCIETVKEEPGVLSSVAAQELAHEKWLMNHFFSSHAHENIVHYIPNDQSPLDTAILLKHSNSTLTSGGNAGPRHGSTPMGNPAQSGDKRRQSSNLTKQPTSTVPTVNPRDQILFISVRSEHSTDPSTSPTPPSVDSPSNSRAQLSSSASIGSSSPASSPNVSGSSSSKELSSIKILVTYPDRDEKITISSAQLRQKGKTILKGSSKKTVSVRKLLDYVSPALNKNNVKRIKANKDILDGLVTLTKARLSYCHADKKFKVGVVYWGGDKQEDATLNQTGSQAFFDFVELLGDQVVLYNWPHFAGGLDTTARSLDGKVSVFTEWSDCQIMYHVAPLMECSAHQKRVHIGNDTLVIVFIDSKKTFKPEYLQSKFNQVFILVYVEHDEALISKASLASLGSLSGSEDYKTPHRSSIHSAGNILSLNSNLLPNIIPPSSGSVKKRSGKRPSVGQADRPSASPTSPASPMMQTGERKIMTPTIVSRLPLAEDLAYRPTSPRSSHPSTPTGGQSSGFILPSPRDGGAHSSSLPDIISPLAFSPNNGIFSDAHNSDSGAYGDDESPNKQVALKRSYREPSVLDETKSNESASRSARSGHEADMDLAESAGEKSLEDFMFSSSEEDDGGHEQPIITNKKNDGTSQDAYAVSNPSNTPDVRNSNEKASVNAIGSHSLKQESISTTSTGSDFASAEQGSRGDASEDSRKYLSARSTSDSSISNTGYTESPQISRKLDEAIAERSEEDSSSSSRKAKNAGDEPPVPAEVVTISPPTPDESADATKTNTTTHTSNPPSLNNIGTKEDMKPSPPIQAQAVASVANASSNSLAHSAPKPGSSFGQPPKDGYLELTSFPGNKRTKKHRVASFGPSLAASVDSISASQPDLPPMQQSPGPDDQIQLHAASTDLISPPSRKKKKAAAIINPTQEFQTPAPPPHDVWYRIAVLRRDGIECFKSKLPYPPLIKSGLEFRNWLLTKITQGMIAAFSSPNFQDRVLVNRVVFLSNLMKSLNSGTSD